MESSERVMKYNGSVDDPFEFQLNRFMNAFAIRKTVNHG